MAGIPTRFIAAELVFERLKGDPKFAFLENPANQPYAYLGAVGGLIGDFLPARPELSDNERNTPQFRTCRLFFQMLTGTADQPGLYSNLSQLRNTLGKLAQVIADKDKFALLGMVDELRALDTVIRNLRTGLENLTARRRQIFTAIRAGRPRVKTSPSTQWWPRETLQGSKTGRFLEMLHRLANDRNDDRLRAYAVGATIAYSVGLCGNPFTNSIVGAPPRNHWWRHRYISNYVDSWVHGFYKMRQAAWGEGADVTFDDRDVPRPLYTNWPNVCSANLQQKIDLGGLTGAGLLNNVRDNTAVPAVLPPEFVDYWLTCFRKTYGQPNPDQGIDAEGLQSAYALTWLTLWVQTSGDVLPANPPDMINFPDTCGERPDWVTVDGGVAVGGTVIPPPDIGRPRNPSVAEIISGIVLAILGAASFALGGIPAGVLAILGATALIADGVTDPDWEKLRCHVGWVFVFQTNLLNALHDLFEVSGFGFPYTYKLAHNVQRRSTFGEIGPPEAALNTARSQPPGNFPAPTWPAEISDWGVRPTGTEPHNHIPYPSDATWPFHFVDGISQLRVDAPTGRPILDQPIQINPLIRAADGLPLVVDNSTWQIVRANLNSSAQRPFGNSVDVALILINSDPRSYLNWDLDGDRGFGSPTWVLPNPSTPPSGAIPEP